MEGKMREFAVAAVGAIVSGMIVGVFMAACLVWLSQ